MKTRRKTKAKRILSLLLALMMIISAVPLSGISVFAAENEDFEYEILEDGTAMITGYNGTASDLVIPSEIAGYKISVIRWSAFWMCTSLVSVTIPNTVISIGTDAFASCYNLKNVRISESVELIVGDVFADCESLENITVEPQNENYCDVDGVLFNKAKTELLIYPDGKKENIYSVPDGVTKISDNAFSGCKFLANLTIPASVTEIGFEVFTKCYSMAKILVDDGNQNYCDLNGVLFDKTKTSLIAFPSAYADKIYEIPNGVVYILWHAFSDCQSLKNVIIPNSVEQVQYNAFENCTSLTNIKIPDNVTWLGGEAFKGCYSLKDVSIGNSVPALYSNTFYNCSKLKNLTIGSGVETIEDSFVSCYELININVSPDNAVFYDIDGVLFGEVDGKKTLLHYPHGREDKVYMVPDGTEVIDPTGYNIIVDKMFIPATVTEISSIYPNVIYAPKGSYAITYAKEEQIDYVESDSMVLERRPSKLIIHKGEDLNTDGIIIAYYDNDFNRTEIKNFTVSGYDKNKTGLQTVKIEWNGYSIDMTVAVSTDDEEYLNFPDLNLEKLLLRRVDYNSDGMVSTDEISQEDMFYSLTGISDISGLEYAVNATVFEFDKTSTVPASERLKLNIYYNMVITENTSESVKLKVTAISDADALEFSSENEKVAKIYIGDDGYVYVEGINEGKTVINVRAGETVKMFEVTVVSPDSATQTPADNLPDIKEYGFSWDVQTASILTQDNKLYSVGFYNNGVRKKLVSDDVKEYSYVGDSTYWHSYTVLENDNSLWCWNVSDDILEKEKLAENVKNYSDSLYLNSENEAKGYSMYAYEMHDDVLTDVQKISSNLALKNDGSVWLYKSVEEGSGYKHYFEKIAEGVSDIIGDMYIKDGCTYEASSQLKVADFAAVDCFTMNQNTYYEIAEYYLIDSNNSLYEVTIRKGKMSINKLCDNFKEFYYGNNQAKPSGYITVNNEIYNTANEKVDLGFPLNEIKHSTDGYVLKNDGTLWKRNLDGSVSLMLTNVVDFAAYNSCIAMRTDGTVWQNMSHTDDTYADAFIQVYDVSRLEVKDKITVEKSDKEGILGYICGIAPGAKGTETIEALRKASLVSGHGSYKLYDASGNEISPDSQLATGMVLEINKYGGIARSYNVDAGILRYEFSVKSDVNGDGKATAVDARWALQCAAGIRELEESFYSAAEMNGDDKITAIDARWVLQVAAGIRTI